MHIKPESNANMCNNCLFGVLKKIEIPFLDKCLNSFYLNTHTSMLNNKIFNQLRRLLWLEKWLHRLHNLINIPASIKSLPAREP